MRYNGKFLLPLVILGFLCSCTQTPEQITEKVRKATVELVDNGSGFFIAPDLIVTNIHVVADAQGVDVFGTDGTGTFKYNIERVIGSDPAHDLVILQVSGKQKETPLSLSNCQIGESIFVAGHPKGGKYKIAGGIVHGKSNTKIRLDARLLPGNSGGPVLNIKGEVVGVAVSVQGVNAIFSDAISSDVLKVLLKKSKSKQGKSLDEWQKEDFIRAYFYDSSGLYKAVDGKYEEAIEDYNKAIELYRDFAAAYINRGVVKYRLGDSKKKDGDMKKARILYEEAIEDLTKNLDSTYAYYQLANVKSDLGDLEANSKGGNAEKALKHYQDALSDYSTAIDKQNRDYPIFLEKVYFYRALAKIRLGELEINKGNAKKAQNLYSEVLDDFAEAIRLDPDSADAFKLTLRTAYDYYVQGGIEIILGQSKASQGDVEKARQLYEAATKNFIEAEKLDTNDGDTYYDKAINVLKPSDADTCQMRGLMKSLRGQSKAKRGEAAGARQHYQEAIKDYQEAIERYGKADEENSRYIVLAYTNMGHTKLFLGKSFESESGQENIKHARSLYEEADADFKKAKEFDPNIGK